NDNPTPSSDCKTKSSSTSFNSLLEETNTSDNSLPEFETFGFDMEEISSGSTTTHSDISLPEYEVFYDDHVKEISSGSLTTHSDSALYASFIFDLSINPFPPSDRSDFYEFADELIPFISSPEYDCFLFKVEPNSGDFTMDVEEDISPTKEPKGHNVLPTHPTLQLNLKFQPSSEYLFTYFVWIFLLFLVYSVAPHYLLSLRSEDTIFDPDICNSHFSRPDVSHRCGTFPRFKVWPERPMEIFSSTFSPMDQGIRGLVRLKTRLTNISASWEETMLIISYSLVYVFNVVKMKVDVAGVSESVFLIIISLYMIFYKSMAVVEVYFLALMYLLILEEENACAISPSYNPKSSQTSSVATFSATFFAISSKPPQERDLHHLLLVVMTRMDVVVEEKTAGSEIGSTRSLKRSECATTSRGSSTSLFSINRFRAGVGTLIGIVGGGGVVLVAIVVVGGGGSVTIIGSSLVDMFSVELGMSMVPFWHRTGTVYEAPYFFLTKICSPDPGTKGYIGTGIDTGSSTCVEGYIQVIILIFVLLRDKASRLHLLPSFGLSSCLLWFDHITRYSWNVFFLDKFFNEDLYEPHI
nr:hypothetical protein [Tanacetum cinerariifolium]